MPRVYLDYNATAPLRPRVAAELQRYLLDPERNNAMGNASSIHWAGQAARRELEKARQNIAEKFARKAGNLILTSGGTEANNLALFGTLLHASCRHRRLILSRVEHPASLAAATRLQHEGVEVVYLDIDATGAPNLAQLKQELQTPTHVVSVMAVNNETGIIMPTEAITALAHEHGALVHIDAVQALGRIPILHTFDLLSMSAHKLGGLKGTGALLISECVPLAAQIVGGPQERGHRAGTENILGALSFALALDEAWQHMPAESIRLAELRDHLESGLIQMGRLTVLGQNSPRVSNTTTVLFDDVEGDALLQALDLAGFAASSGSACSSGSLEPSHVLLAMGIPAQKALAAVRFSLGWNSQKADVEALLDALPNILRQTRLL